MLKVCYEKSLKSMSSVIRKYVMDILMYVLKQILTIDSEEGDFWVLEFQYYVSTMLKAKEVLRRTREA